MVGGPIAGGLWDVKKEGRAVWMDGGRGQIYDHTFVGGP